MPNIILCPSLALDTICFTEACNMHNKEWRNKEQVEAIEYINSLLPKDFEKEYLGMSTLSLIISAYTDNRLETMILDELISIFEKTDHIGEQ